MSMAVLLAMLSLPGWSCFDWSVALCEVNTCFVGYYTTCVPREDVIFSHGFEFD